MNIFLEANKDHYYDYYYYYYYYDYYYYYYYYDYYYYYYYNNFYTRQLKFTSWYSPPGGEIWEQSESIQKSNFPQPSGRDRTII